MYENSNFNPRSPCGERQTEWNSFYEAVIISIHALRVESDAYHLRRKFPDIHFNPRSPCGERLAGRSYPLDQSLFQSTLSVWRATFRTPPFNLSCVISIHALRVESDPLRNVRTGYTGRFQSTLSVWRATPKDGRISRRGVISIHALRVESDRIACGT